MWWAKVCLFGCSWFGPYNTAYECAVALKPKVVNSAVLTCARQCENAVCQEEISFTNSSQGEMVFVWTPSN
jgi:hypothetical protein